MLKSEKHTHPLLQVNPAQINESEDEGGLNLLQVGAALRRRTLLIVGVTGVVATAAVLKAETDPPLYQGEFDILTKSLTGEGRAVANVPQTLTAQESVSSPETVQPIATTLQVLQSPGVLDPVVEKIQKKYQSKYPDLDLSYNSLVQNLSITSKDPNILKVQYTSPKEDIARDFSKSVADAYLKYSLAERQADIDQAIKFVQDRINKGGLRKRVEDWQEKLRTLRQANSLVDPAQKSQQVSSLIATFTQQKLDNRVQLEQMQAKYQDLQREFKQEPGQSASNSVLSDNPRYQKLLDQIQDVDVQLAKRGSTFTEEEEGVQRLTLQRTSILSMLNQERARVSRDFQSRILELQARDQSLSQKLTNLNSYLRTLATISRDYENIQQELKIATATLDQFLAKQQALEIEKSQKQQPWKLLDPKLTEVKEPAAVSASIKRNLVLGSMLGMLLGVGAALVVDKLSNVLYTSKDLKDASGLPLLGVVPFKKEFGASALQENADSGLQQALRASFFEVFRSLYTNILLLGSDAPIRSLVISSAGYQDGKSTISIHLALAAAAMGQRVLLVDANLRFPTLHQRVGLMNIQGLTDVISADLDWRNVIEQSPIEENLFVLTAGPIPPDPVRLLASQKMQDLMDNLQGAFDLVIYDTPPLVGFADANLLSANTNGVILVAGLGKLKRTVFQQALEEIQVAGTPVLGIVANKSKDAVPASYDYYQQYYKQNINLIGDDDDSSIGYSSPLSSSLRRVNRK